MLFYKNNFLAYHSFNLYTCFNLSIVNFNISMHVIFDFISIINLNICFIFCVESRTTDGKLRLFEWRERDFGMLSTQMRRRRRRRRKSNLRIMEEKQNEREKLREGQ